MARSSKGAGNLLGPLVIVAVVVVGILVFTFSMSSEDVPDEPTIIAEDDAPDTPAGAGTTPEGEADESMEGVTDQLDDVTPAAPGEESVPPADNEPENGSDEQAEGETSADETTAGTADQPVVTDEPGSQAAGSGSEADEAQTEETGQAVDEDAQDDAAGSSDNFILDENSNEQPTDDVVDPSGEGLPAGRDAETDLDPENEDDVVRDTDDGGAAFIATPSGPDGRDDETVAE
ncbi:hypothetical protein [Palleronia sp. LCG004]|uniref:hypothetical protein n=1 Tax=Palleronia sp. LCG004 TaxID=3079304 RepID=UPI002941F480|nr:hypothetical protein [Palleronia sp. LCG004]WOI55487.1 hypothetical protein RVY76_10575 [Palleronia sp. LCG004]